MAGRLPTTEANPLLELLDSARARTPEDRDRQRDTAVREHGFAVPTDEVAETVRSSAPHGVIEIGAGTGYWAAFLAARGIDVVAYDLHPAPSVANDWFSGTTPWFPVVEGDHRVVADHGGRALLLVWPTKDETWPLEALDLYASSGGGTVLYVGEGPGGRTGDDAFHARLGEMATCQQCAYRVADAPCTCAVAARWERVRTVTLPHWPGFVDDLHVYRRRPDRVRRGRRQSVRAMFANNVQ